VKPLPYQAMSEEQLSALLAKLKEDAGLREKLQGAADLDAAVVIAKEAGFDVSQADWLKYQAKQPLELSDEELESAAGGKAAPKGEDSRIGGCWGSCVTEGVVQVKRCVWS
jgi:predicted ribosomally synthesized peptide with nif11-like leader